MNKNHFLILIATAILVGGLSFYGGVQYASGNNQKGAQTQGNNAMGNGQGFRNGRTGNGALAGAEIINGSILSKDDQSITLKLRDGGSKIVFFSASTEISKFVKGASEDLKENVTVMVNGKANTDGSVTAKTIQIRPEGQGFGPNGIK